MGKTDREDLMLNRWFEKTVQKIGYGLIRFMLCVNKIIKLFWIQCKLGLATS